jgi:hypothetical protein
MPTDISKVSFLGGPQIDPHQAEENPHLLAVGVLDSSNYQLTTSSPDFGAW